MAQSEDWRYIAVIAPLQTVEVQTPRGDYAADFEAIVLVYPNGKANVYTKINRYRSEFPGAHATSPQKRAMLFLP